MPGMDMGIGAGASVAGGTMQAIAASQAAKAMKHAFERQLQEQGKYRTQAVGEFNQALPLRGVEEARNEIAQGSQNRQNFYGKFASTPLSLGSGPSARDNAAYNLAGTARGNLGGYSDWALQQMIHNIRTQDALNKISNFAQGSAGVFPYKMYDAQHSADELAFWGNLVSSVGGSAGSWSSLFGQGPQGMGQPQTYGTPTVRGGFDAPTGYGSNYGAYA